jgi:hypothetical protein
MAVSRDSLRRRQLGSQQDPKNVATCKLSYGLRRAENYFAYAKLFGHVAFSIPYQLLV